MANSKCKIRKDLQEAGDGVPVGEGYYRSPEPIEYRWVNEAGEPDEDGDDFQVFHDGQWQPAYSIDFDFLD